METNQFNQFYKNDWNIDKALIALTPFVLLLILVWMPEEWVVESSLLCISIVSYIIFTYKNRLIYGFSGIRIFSIPSIIIATYTAFISIPSIYVLMIRDSSSESAYFYSIILFYYLFPAGLFVGQLLSGIDYKRVHGLLLGGFYKEKNDKIFYEIALVTFSFCLLILFGYLLRVNEIPLLELIKNPGDNLKFALLREDALKVLQMTKIEKYLFHWLRSLFIPFGIVSSLFLYSAYDRNKYKYLFFIFLFFGLVVNSLTLEKSPIAAIFLSVATFVLLKKEKINLKLVFSLMIVILSGPILVSYMLFIDRADVFEVLLWSYINRIFVTPAEVLYYYFQYFPETHDFLMGRSTQIFSWLSIEGTFNVSNYVAKLWWNVSDTTGSANANYLGNYWSDFGWYGTTISTFVLGVIIHLYQRIILEATNYTKNILYITTISVSAPLFTFGFFSYNFTILFFTKGLFLLILFLFGYNYWQKNAAKQM